MCDDEMQKRVPLFHYWKKGVNATEAVRQINDIEGDDTVMTYLQVRHSDYLKNSKKVIPALKELKVPVGCPHLISKNM